MSEEATNGESKHIDKDEEEEMKWNKKTRVMYN
jgi:hypothetical protein